MNFSMYSLLCAVGFYAQLHALPADYDTTFGPNGTGYFTFLPTVFTDVANIDMGIYGTALAHQTDGSILFAVTGCANPGISEAGIAIARFTVNGILDTTFNPSATGSSGQQGVFAVLLSDLNPATFSGIFPVCKMLVDSQGRIVVVAGLFVDASSRVCTFMFRIHGSANTGTPGTIDTSFGTNGYTTLTNTLITGGTLAVDAVFDSQERIVVATGPTVGALGPATTKISYLERFSANGVADGTFGAGGILALPAITQGFVAIGISDIINDIFYLKMVNSINSSPTVLGIDKPATMALLKVTASTGSIDTSFGTEGVLYMPLLKNDLNDSGGPAMVYATAHEVHILNSVPQTVGVGLFNNILYQTLTKITANGGTPFTMTYFARFSPEAPFIGANGYLAQPFAGEANLAAGSQTGMYPAIRGLGGTAILSDGSIMLAGTYGDTIDDSFNGLGYPVVAKLTSSGAPDTTFTYTGAATDTGAHKFDTTVFNNRNVGRYSALLVQSTGAIVCGGTVGFNNAYDASTGIIAPTTPNNTIPFLARYQGSGVTPPTPPPTPETRIACAEIARSPLGQSIINKYYTPGTQAANCVGPVPTGIKSPCCTD